MLADVFENYWNMFLELYEVEPANIFSATGLAWQAGLKKPKVKWDLLTDIDMLLMAKKGMRSGTCHAIYWYVKADNEYLKNYEKKKKNHHILSIRT